MSVETLDLSFQERTGVIASYVFDTGDGLALVDTGPASTLPALEEGLSRLGAGLRDVRHLLLTHIHLDHAGAAGQILERVRGARAYVHERGALHLVRPGRLLTSAAQIYGDHMQRLWGEVLPADQSRLRVLSGGEGLRIGSCEVHALYTPGHAVHHLAYHVGDDLFVGDVGGIRLDLRQSPRAPTPPPDINLEDWKASIKLLRSQDARTLYLAHFGAYPQEAGHWDRLLHHLHADAQRVRAALEQGRSEEYISAQFTEEVLAELAAEGADLPERFEFACPPWMSVQGLMRYWAKQSPKEGEQ